MKTVIKILLAGVALACLTFTAQAQFNQIMGSATVTANTNWVDATSTNTLTGHTFSYPRTRTVTLQGGFKLANACPTPGNITFKIDASANGGATWHTNWSRVIVSGATTGWNVGTTNVDLAGLTTFRLGAIECLATNVGGITNVMFDVNGKLGL